MRCHKLMMDGILTYEEIRAHYNRLPANDQGKDWKPFNKLPVLLKKFDGGPDLPALRIPQQISKDHSR